MTVTRNDGESGVFEEMEKHNGEEVVKLKDKDFFFKH